MSAFTGVEVAIAGVLVSVALAAKTTVDYLLGRRKLNAEVELAYINRRSNLSDDGIADSESPDTVVRELLRRQTVLLEQLLSKDPNIVLNVGGPATDSLSHGLTTSDPRSSDIGSVELMRVLSHSLNTPLSQLEALILSSRTAGPPRSDAEFQDLLTRLYHGVEVCKAFMSAFRNLTEATASGGWNPASLSDSVAHAAKLYADASDRDDLRIDVQLPDSLEGYGNAYVTAVLLPLVENAIESATQNTVVSISASESLDPPLVTVENHASPAPLDSIFQQGVSTKPEHQGLGLSIVEALLAQRGGRVRLNSGDGLVRFVVMLGSET